MKVFEGKVALVTGAAGGIGEAVTRLLADRGGRVMMADVRLDRGQAIATGIGDSVECVQLDVSSEVEWSGAVARTLDAFGRLDILVNNAGVFEAGLLETTTRESFERMIAVNQIGCFLGMKSVASAMREGGGGSIVNVASAAAIAGNPGLFGYTATKWAIRGMTKTAAAELGRHGIRVNAVLPGSIDTDMVRSQDAPGRAAFFESLPVARQGQPGDVAEIVCFLASEQGGYCTGADFVIDGGLTATRGTPPRRDPVS
jgi:3alpha(or 20beta)-hydroxysteroid dehydrogenase